MDDRWKERAACNSPVVDPEVFYPERGSNGDPARAICATCPVNVECLAYALELQGPTHDHGVWGGTVERERRAIRRELKLLKQAAYSWTPL